MLQIWHTTTFHFYNDSCLYHGEWTGVNETNHAKMPILSSVSVVQTLTCKYINNPDRQTQFMLQHLIFLSFSAILIK